VLQVLQEQIRDIIGPRGETIQKICAETGCEIDIDQDGPVPLVMITAPNQEKGEMAKKWVQQITYIPKVGDEFDGKVTRLMDFGAFVEFSPGKEGLVHISNLDHRRVNRVEDVCKVGDSMKVKLFEIDDMGRYNLSRKACLPVPKGMPTMPSPAAAFGSRKPPFRPR
jgi:polyribonucleotide nucleotidyltransferase